MFKCVETREYKLGDKTIVWSETTTEGATTYRISEYGPRLTAEELRQVAKNTLAFCDKLLPLASRTALLSE